MNKPISIEDDPYLSEYVFHCILNAPQDVKNKLPTRLIKHTHSVERIKSFAMKAKLGQKLEMIARLGGAFALHLHPPGWFSADKVKEIMNNFLNNQRDKDVQEMVDKKIFVTTDRETLAVFYLMAMNCHNGTYILNRDYATMATQIVCSEKVNTKINDIESMKSAMEDQKLIMKFMLYSIISHSFTDMDRSYHTKEITVLLLLFVNRHTYVTLQMQQDFFQGIYSPTLVHRILMRLVKENLVNKIHGQWKYTVSSQGIQMLGRMLGRIANSTLYS
jgi:hypothetical protein